MRTARQVKVIHSHIEVLEELKEQLQSVFTYIDNVLQKGVSWIKGEENESFIQMNYYLTNETAEVLQLCLNLTNGTEELLQPVNSSEEDKGISTISVSNSSSASFTDQEKQKLVEEMKGVEKIIAKQSKTLKVLKQKNKEQENETTKKIQQLKEEMERKNELKIKEIMTELQAASNFMTELQMKNELLTNQINENLKQQNKLVDQKLNSFTEENVGKDDSYHRVEFDEIKKRVSQNCDDIKEVKIQTGCMLMSLNDVIKKLEDMSLVVDLLKTSCHDNADKEDLNIKIQSVLSQVSDLSKQDVAVGFDAYVPESTTEIDFEDDQIMTCFTHVVENLNNNYDPETGIFTVPVNGLYLCSLVIDVSSYLSQEIDFSIVCLKQVDGGEEERKVSASCHTSYDNSKLVSDVSIRRFDKEDKIYVKANFDCDDVELTSYSHFMCLLIKQI